MPTLAGWLTGEQVPQEVIQQTLEVMGNVLGSHGGTPNLTIQPGAGLISFADPAYAMRRNDEPPVLDWVPDRRTLVYRRPLSGFHPLYYIENWPAQGNLLFASEIKALFAVGVPRQIHLAALDALLRYNFIPAPWTAFKDIQIVPAGSILRWQRAKTVLNHATDYRLDEIIHTHSTEVMDQLAQLLADVTTALLPPEEEFVALSGGGPASALATMYAAQNTESQCTLASLAHSDAEQQWQGVENIADAAQCSFLAVTSSDEPEFWLATLNATETPGTDTYALALHQLLHTASVETEARVAITGLGARTLLLDRSLPAHEAKPQDVLAWYSSKQSPTMEPTVWSRDVQQQLRTTEPWEQTLHAQKLARRAAQYTDIQLADYYLDLHLRLPDAQVAPFYQLANQDRLAIRSSYLHADILDLLTRLPVQFEDGYKKGTILSHLLDRLLPARQHAALPLNFPIRTLFRQDSDLYQQTLAPAAIRTSGLFDEQAVTRLLKANSTEAAPELLFVFTTQLLFQLFGASIA